MMVKSGETLQLVTSPVELTSTVLAHIGMGLFLYRGFCSIKENDTAIHYALSSTYN
jgi:hypothetical protein